MAGPSFCFVHAADLHLDTPFVGVGKAAPAVAEALREASLAAFDAVVELALAREAAFFLVAGDVYDGAERGLRAQLRFRDGLGRLSAVGTPSFVVHGNHDPVATGWSAVASWPEGVTVFGATGVTVVPVRRGGEQIATVQGISYATRSTTENLARRLRRPEGAGVHVGVLHCNVEGAGEGHANYSPCTLDDLWATGLDYLALGHVHEHRVLSGGRPGEPWVVYPGNTQARSPRRTENGPKGAVVASVLDGVVVDVEHVPCDRIRFVELESDVGTVDDLPSLEERLLEAADRTLAEAGGRSLIARGRLVGRGELHAQLARPAVCEELLTTLREQTADREPFCWWDSITDESAAPIDRSALRGRGDFAGDLAELAAELAAGLAAGRLDARALAASIGTPPRSMAGLLEELLGSGEALDEMLDAAADLALDTLGGQQ